MHLIELCPDGNPECPGSSRRFSADAHTLVPMKCNSNLTDKSSKSQLLNLVCKVLLHTLPCRDHLYHLL